MLGRAGGGGTLGCSRFEIQAEGESRCLTWAVCAPLGLLGVRVCSPLEN